MNQPRAPHAPYTPQASASPVTRTREPRRWRWMSALVVPAVVFGAVWLFGHGSVPASDVGQHLTDRFGAPVSCTEDLPAAVGATITCIGHDTDGTTHHIQVTATAVDGSQVEFDGHVQD